MRKKLQSVEELVSAIGLLVRRVRSERASQDLSMTGSLVMGRLARDGAATIADLARAEKIKPQSMGATVATLERSGIVRRKAHPTDGRQVLVELTREGGALRDSVRIEKLVWLEQAIARLDTAERDALYAASPIIARLAES
jgi:DNA-binding MarR family transcriptional regulator